MSRSLGSAHLAEMSQLHDLDVIRTELHYPFLILYRDQLTHSLTIFARDHLWTIKLDFIRD